MSFNRLHYDACAYAKNIKQSVSPLEYQLYLGKFENVKPCPCKDNKHECNVPFETRADVENELYNLNRPGTLCPEKKYNPKADNYSHNYHPPTLCQGIYHITPSGLKKPTTNGIDN